MESLLASTADPGNSGSGMELSGGTKIKGASKMTAFLEYCGLEECGPELAENGIDLLDDLMTLEEEDLVSLGVSHAALLVESLQSGGKIKRDGDCWVVTGYKVHNLHPDPEPQEEPAPMFPVSQVEEIDHKNPSGKSFPKQPSLRSKARRGSRSGKARPSGGKGGESSKSLLEEDGGGGCCGCFGGGGGKKGRASPKARALAGDVVVATSLLQAALASKDVESCRWLASALADACDTPNARARAATCDASLALVSAVQQHMDDVVVVQQGGRALANLASGDLPCKHRLLECKALEALGPSFPRHVATAGACFQVVRVFANLACGDERSKLAVVHGGGALLACSAMETHAQDAAMHNAAAACLANLAAETPTRGAVVEAGGAQAMSGAMARHRGNAAVGTHCARALANLGSGDAACVQSVQECGAAAACVAALAAHPQATDLAAWGLRLLANVCITEEGERIALQAGAAAAAVGALRIHVESAAVQAEGLASLSNLAASSDAACRAAVVDAGGAAAGARALDKLASVAPVLEQACALLANLSRGDARCQDAVVAAKGCEGVVARMKEQGAALGVQRFGCRVLAALAGGTAPSRAALIHAGAIGAVCTGMGRHAAASELQQEGCLFLALLSGGDDACVRALKRSNAADAVKRALKAHADNPSIRESAMIFKDSIAASWEDSGKRHGSSKGKPSPRPNGEGKATSKEAVMRF